MTHLRLVPDLAPTDPALADGEIDKLLRAYEQLSKLEDRTNPFSLQFQEEMEGLIAEKMTVLDDLVFWIKASKEKA